MSCKSEGCSYNINPDPRNNNGNHCCHACMNQPNHHGPACKHIVTNKNMQIVIARFREDISWSASLPNRVVYKKGYITPDSISLPNVGREGHTFAYHIVQNYDNLFEYTCFLQGDPFDHCPNVLDIIQKPPSEPFRALAKKISPFNLDCCKHHSNLPLRQCYKILFDADSTATYDFGHGAQMIVSRDTIRRHPKEFYQKIVDMLGYSTNPVEGFVIERFWKLIFTE